MSTKVNTTTTETAQNNNGDVLAPVSLGGRSQSFGASGNIGAGGSVSIDNKRTASGNITGSVASGGTLLGSGATYIEDLNADLAAEVVAGSNALALGLARDANTTARELAAAGNAFAFGLAADSADLAGSLGLGALSTARAVVDDGNATARALASESNELALRLASGATDAARGFASDSAALTRSYLATASGLAADSADLARDALVASAQGVGVVSDAFAAQLRSMEKLTGNLVAEQNNTTRQFFGQQSQTTREVTAAANKNVELLIGALADQQKSGQEFQAGLVQGFQTLTESTADTLRGALSSTLQAPALAAPAVTTAATDRSAETTVTLQKDDTAARIAYVGGAVLALYILTRRN